MFSYIDYIWIICLFECSLLGSNNLFILAVLQGEARHKIGQLANFGRSRQSDDTLEIAAPGRQNQPIQ